MSKINSGILYNTEPLTEEQFNNARRHTLETGEAIACLNADQELCFLMPTDPKILKELAWDRAEELYTNDSNRVELALYRKSDTNAFFLEQHLQLLEEPASPSWSFEGAGAGGRFIYVGDGRSISITDSAYAPQSQLYIPALVQTTQSSTPTVTAIAAGAFRGSGTLTYVNIPPTVTNIEAYAFSECPNLTEIDLGNYEGNLPDSVCGNCPSFTTFSVGATNKKYSVVDGLLLNAEKTALVRCPSGRAECICPNGVQEIKAAAFAYGKLSAVTIPTSVTSIASHAFSYTPSCLTTITYKGTVGQWEQITKETNWQSLSSIKYVQCSNGLCTLAGALVPLDHEYLKGKYTTNAVTITGYKENIPAEVIIPDNISGYPVTSISSSAFKNNTKITSVSIPDTVTNISATAFEGCSSLATVSLGDGVRSIGERCFYGCTSLTEILLPASLTTIGLWAFEGCTSLEVIGCNYQNSTFLSENGVLFDNKRTTLLRYPPARPVTGFTVPTGVTTIANSAFTYSNNLTTVVLPASVTIIESNAFSGCNKIKTFRYNATKARWTNGVTKHTNWNIGSSIKQVVCADGTIIL